MTLVCLSDVYYLKAQHIVSMYVRRFTRTNRSQYWQVIITYRLTDTDFKQIDMQEMSSEKLAIQQLSELAQAVDKALTSTK